MNYYITDSKLVLFLFLTLYLSSFSQNKTKIDSLGELLKEKDLSQVERSKNLTLRAYYFSDIDSSLISANLALSIAKEIKKPILQAEAWEEISHVERRLGNNSSSLNASLNALRIYDSLDLYERKGAVYSQLAINSTTDEDYDSAIKYLKQTIDIYTKSERIDLQTLSKLNLGETYRLAGQLDSAVVYFRETLVGNKTINSDIIESYSLGNLGMVLFALDSLEVAKIHLNRAINILEPLGDAYSTSVYKAELGRIYWKESKWDLAEDTLLAVYDLAMAAGLKEQIRGFSRLLTDFYKERQRYDKALSYLEINRVYQDSLVNKASIQQVEQLKANYEIGKRETEIKLLNTINTTQKNQLIILGVGAFFISVLAYMLFRSNKTINKVNKHIRAQNEVIEKREQEKALLLKELNHRVKNNLQMISSLLNLQSRELSGHPAQEAILTGKNRVEALSLVHRKLYQEGSETKVFLRDYIEELVLGLFHGYNASFKPNLAIDDTSISIDKAIPLALIVNELVVNSLKYAYDGISNPVFKMQLEEQNDTIEMNISDNGIGFINAIDTKQSSFGIKLIRSLAAQLDAIIEKKRSKGTHWNIILKRT